MQPWLHLDYTSWSSGEHHSSPREKILFFPALGEITAFTAHVHSRAGGKSAYQKKLFQIENMSQSCS